MKTLITLMHGTISKEHTLFGPKLEFATIVRAKMRPACTPKHFEEGIIRRFMKQEFNRCFHM
jgi:hypothetical protein